MKFSIPKPLQAEHAELHAELVIATKAGGRVGEAATVVAKRLHSHFSREEQLALPPLALLAALAKGTIDSDMADVLTLTDKLETELPGMLDEHKQIVEALHRLVAAAEAEKKPQHVRFAEKLILHAQTEEEILYPAAILVGRYVKLKLSK